MHSSTGWYSVAYWQKAVVSSLTILSLVAMTAGPLLTPAVAFADDEHNENEGGAAITIVKLIDADGTLDTINDQTSGGAGWHFTVGTTDVVTDSNGSVIATHVHGAPDITEVQQEGYKLLSSKCVLTAHEHQGDDEDEHHDGESRGEEDNQNDNEHHEHHGHKHVEANDNDAITCTFINARATGTLHIVKHVVGSNVSPSNFSFYVDEGANTTFEADGQNDVVLPTGTHSVTEKPDAAYTTSYDGCSEINITDNGEATCTITNTLKAPQCDANATHHVYSDTTTLIGNVATALVDIDAAAGIQLHSAWTASIPGAVWIWGENPLADAANDVTETFTKTFTIVGTPTADATLTIAADNSYSVDVNGHTAVCVDATEDNFTTADTCTIPQADLLTGSNTITFTVKNWAQANGTPQSNPAGLMYDLSYSANECNVATCVADVNLIKNGSFEAPVVTSASNWDLFANATPLLEWVTRFVSGNASPVLEIQRHYSGWLASDGEQFAELDSNESTSIAQDITTIPGKTYKVAFDFAARPDASDITDNAANVFFGGAALASVSSNTVGANATVWQHHEYTVVATSTSTRIEFTDAGTSNSLGSFVDKVSVSCVPPVVEPPTECPSGQHLVETTCVTDTPPVTPPTPPGGGGGGNPSFASIGGFGGGNGPIGQVAGASCGLSLDKHMKQGSPKNDKEQVKKLQQILNKYGFGPIPVTGVFGPSTAAAVKAFQAKYGDDVLKPWNLNGPTGLVYLSTLRKINLLECPDLSLPLPTLIPWSANPHAQ